MCLFYRHFWEGFARQVDSYFSYFSLSSLKALLYYVTACGNADVKAATHESNCCPFVGNMSLHSIFIILIVGLKILTCILNWKISKLHQCLYIFCSTTKMFKSLKYLKNCSLLRYLLLPLSHLPTSVIHVSRVHSF